MLPTASCPRRTGSAHHGNRLPISSCPPWGHAGQGFPAQCPVSPWRGFEGVSRHLKTPARQGRIRYTSGPKHGGDSALVRRMGGARGRPCGRRAGSRRPRGGWPLLLSQAQNAAQIRHAPVQARHVFAEVVHAARLEAFYRGDPQPFVPLQMGHIAVAESAVWEPVLARI